MHYKQIRSLEENEYDILMLQKTHLLEKHKPNQTWVPHLWHKPTKKKEEAIIVDKRASL